MNAAGENAGLRVLVDADACPKVIKEILFRAAEKRGVRVILVANSRLSVPGSGNVEFVRVGAGFDEADKAIAAMAQSGDIVITTDIPLAASVIEKGGTGLSPRGEVFTAENIRSRLTMRDFMDELRGSGVMTGGPAALRPRDRQEFANQLDRMLTAGGF